MKLAVTIDITNRCNLKCKFCYYYSQKFPRKELKDEEWLEKIEWIKKTFKPIHCSWLGGEPLLRYNLLKNLTKKFVTNWVFTNGTLPILHLSRTSYGISVYGPKRVHNFLRDNSYDRIKENILASSEKIFLISVINKYNYRHIEELVEDWINTNVRGISFYFLGNVNDEKIRSETFRKLYRIKKEYPKFILFPSEILESRHREECIIPKISVSFASDGSIKKPCFFGFSCSECLCTLPTIFEKMFKLHLPTIFNFLKSFTIR